MYIILRVRSINLTNGCVMKANLSTQDKKSNYFYEAFNYPSEDKTTHK